MFSSKDLDLLKSKEISPQEAEEQVICFEKGFPFLEVINTATTQKGITVISQDKLDKYISEWDIYSESLHKILKFVPASGAASRMFKDLFEFLDGIADLPETDFTKTFFINIKKFAFYNELNECCVKNDEKDIDELISTNQFKAIIRNLLSKDGLNYGNLPKGLLQFHSYDNYSRTPVEEHMVEGCMYARSANRTANLHFTVSPEHRPLFESLLNNIQKKYEKDLDITFNISFSEQKPKTDTIAVNMDNTPFREENGEILFRPGGHGALIENLNDLDADIIFIKNIDNVVPDRLKKDESMYKKILAGYLVNIQKKIFEYLKLIDSGNYTREQLLDILHFTQNELNTKNPEIKYLEDAELVIYLKKKLNRPVRVCGMVRNIGEPGGGPFFTVNQDGTVSLQILESSQIDMDDPEKKAMFQQGTHFNPVDLVCGVKDYQGNKFDLKAFVDKNTGFISRKSKNGKELKALELPGLWNGAMSDWNTIFIEVPLSTFNPVKNVNDLLRKEHQN
ncbi:DUF4301 family protein [Dysgonomonas sp. OttesenSCG-928-M03]|nr:DUF4301 family protein [Dysgonomonas sp. OttesenSCG-928-M03]